MDMYQKRKIRAEKKNNDSQKSFSKVLISWYPGHMTKAKRMMVEDIKLIDLVIELVDARIPMSSRNPDIDSLAQGKSRVILLNKADLADDRITGQWFDFFSAKGYHVVKIDSRDRGKMKNVKSIIDNACKEKKERDRKRGIINRPVRAMVAGIPNVGKSTFINSFAGKACAQTGNKPGVTKGKQWIRLNKDVELLDTPGILWPKFEDNTVGIRLAFIGSVNDQVINMHELAGELVAYMTRLYPGRLTERYKADESLQIADILRCIATSRGCLKKGGEIDYDKAVSILFDDFRSGKLGKLSLESPEEYL